MIHSPGDWERAIAVIADSGGLVMVMGASDTGKTTWVRWAARQLIQNGTIPVGIVDADLGQTTLGPPAAVALKFLERMSQLEDILNPVFCDAVSFVGSVSPVGHLLQTLVACKLLVEKAKQSGTKTILVDTSGLVTAGLGFQLKLRKIELLNPDHLVVLQHGTELDSLLKVLKGRPGLTIHRLPVSQFAKTRTAVERVAHRAQRFSTYFVKADRVSFAADQLIILTSTKRVNPYGHDATDLSSPEALQSHELFGLLVGLNNAADETLGLGLLEGASEDGNDIYVKTPLQDVSAVRILQMGTFCLNQAFKEIRPKRM